jgi:hypothetical protein
MAYSATLANMRGILSDEEHKRLLNLFSRVGLSMDDDHFTEDILDKATKAILKVRRCLFMSTKNHPTNNYFSRLAMASSVLQSPALSAHASSSTTLSPAR